MNEKFIRISLNIHTYEKETINRSPPAGAMINQLGQVRES